MRPLCTRCGNASLFIPPIAGNLPVAENLLDRKFETDLPNRAWVSNIPMCAHEQAGFILPQSWICSHAKSSSVGAIAPCMPAKLVASALRMAIQQSRPAPGLLLHSDRGTQYASLEYQSLLDQHGIRCSMSRKGNCWDNAVMERFFLNLKMERVWQQDYANHSEAQRDITDYIVSFYNGTRLHSKLGYLSPAVYERKMAAMHLSRCLKLLDRYKTVPCRTFLSPRESISGNSRSYSFLYPPLPIGERDGERVSECSPLW